MVGSSVKYAPHGPIPPESICNNTVESTTAVSKRKNVTKSMNSTLLLDIGPLVKGTLIKRPSSTIKSPYVADVELPSPNKNKSILAHAPALNVGGLCIPNKPVYLSTRDNKKSDSKTSHAIELVVSLGCTPSDPDVLVGAHPRLAELLVEKVLNLGLLQDVLEFGSITEVRTKATKSNKDEELALKDDDVILRRQFTYGDSRIDFAIQAPSKLYLIEVKNVVCADYHESNAPEKSKKSDDRCVITSDVPIDTYKRSALFPWGKVNQKFEGKKVVSERAIKHVRNLATFVNTVDNDMVVQPIIIFVVNRDDCGKMRLCHEACPTFAQEVGIAREKGVIVIGFSVRWGRDGKAYFNGIVPVDTSFHLNDRTISS